MRRDPDFYFSLQLQVGILFATVAVLAVLLAYWHGEHP